MQSIWLINCKITGWINERHTTITGHYTPERHHLPNYITYELRDCDDPADGDFASVHHRVRVQRGGYLLVETPFLAMDEQLNIDEFVWTSNWYIHQ